jgi:hypothetical protein
MTVEDVPSPAGPGASGRVLDDRERADPRPDALGPDRSPRVDSPRDEPRPDPRRPDGRPAGRPGPDRAGGVRARLAPLFEPAPRRPVRAWAVLTAGLAVVVAAWYSLERVGGPGPLNTVWAEDASNFLTDALTRPALSNLVEPVNGYFLLLPRLLSQVAVLFPVSWQAAVLSGSAALSSAAMALLVYFAGARSLGHPLARLVVAASVLVAPLGESMFSGAPNEVAPLQFVQLYALFWCVMWTPVRRSARAVMVAFVLLTGLSTFLAVLYLPLVALRLWVRRDRLSVAVLAAFLLGAAAQVAGLASGVSSREDISHPRLDPLWALERYVTWAMPYGLLGQRGMRHPAMVNMLVHAGGGGRQYWAGVALAWLVVAAAVLLALLRWTAPSWLFAAVVAAHAVGLLCMEVMVQGELVLRYAYTPWLLTVVALAALLLPRADLPRWRAAAPLAALAALLLVAGLANYRLDTLRARALPWDGQVREARAACAAAEHPATATVQMSRVYGWSVTIPCDRLR